MKNKALTHPSAAKFYLAGGMRTDSITDRSFVPDSEGAFCSQPFPQANISSSSNSSNSYTVGTPVRVPNLNQAAKQQCRNNQVANIYNIASFWHAPRDVTYIYFTSPKDVTYIYFTSPKDVVVFLK